MQHICLIRNGTLIDDVFLWEQALVVGFESVGQYANPEIIKEYLQGEGSDMLQHGITNPYSFWSTATQRYIQSLDQAKLYSDVVPVFEKIKEQCSMIGIVTNFERAPFTAQLVLHGLLQHYYCDR